MRFFPKCLALLAVIFLPLKALAYVGPGAGLSFAGSFLALLVSVLVALAVILFWPLRLILRRMRGKGGSADEAGESEAKGSDPR